MMSVPYIMISFIGDISSWISFMRVGHDKCCIGNFSEKNAGRRALNSEKIISHGDFGCDNIMAHFFQQIAAGRHQIFPCRHYWATGGPVPKQAMGVRMTSQSPDDVQVCSLLAMSTAENFGVGKKTQLMDWKWQSICKVEVWELAAHHIPHWTHGSGRRNKKLCWVARLFLWWT